jgi:hypothetical protein
VEEGRGEGASSIPRPTPQSAREGCGGGREAPREKVRVGARGHCELEVDVAPVREERRGGRLELHAAASQDVVAAAEEGDGPPDLVPRHCREQQTRGARAGSPPAPVEEGRHSTGRRELHRSRPRGLPCSNRGSSLWIEAAQCGRRGRRRSRGEKKKRREEKKSEEGS